MISAMLTSCISYSARNNSSIQKLTLSAEEIKRQVMDLSNEDVVLKQLPERVGPFFSKKAFTVYFIMDSRMIPYLRKNLNDDKKFIAAHVLLTLLTQKGYQIGPSTWNHVNVRELHDNPQKVQMFLLKYWRSKKNLTIIANRNRSIPVGLLKSTSKRNPQNESLLISGPAPAKFDIFVFNYLRKTAQNIA